MNNRIRRWNFWIGMGCLMGLFAVASGLSEGSQNSKSTTTSSFDYGNLNVSGIRTIHVPPKSNGLQHFVFGGLPLNIILTDPSAKIIAPRIEGSISVAGKVLETASISGGVVATLFDKNQPETSTIMKSSAIYYTRVSQLEAEITSNSPITFQNDATSQNGVKTKTTLSGENGRFLLMTPSQGNPSLSHGELNSHVKFNFVSEGNSKEAPEKLSGVSSKLTINKTKNDSYTIVLSGNVKIEGDSSQYFANSNMDNLTIVMDSNLKFLSMDSGDDSATGTIQVKLPKLKKSPSGANP